MKLRFTPQAVADLGEIADYLKARSPSAASNVRASIYSGLERLLLFPTLGRRQTTESVRKLVTPRYGYLVYCTLHTDEEEVIVLAVKHPARERSYEDE